MILWSGMGSRAKESVLARPDLTQDRPSLALSEIYTVQGPGQARADPFSLALDPGSQGQARTNPDP